MLNSRNLREIRLPISGGPLSPFAVLRIFATERNIFTCFCDGEITRSTVVIFAGLNYIIYLIIQLALYSNNLVY